MSQYNQQYRQNFYGSQGAPSMYSAQNMNAFPQQQQAFTRQNVDWYRSGANNNSNSCNCNFPVPRSGKR